MDFIGQRFLVVGGTKGIGNAIVGQLSKLGAHVTFVGRTPPIVPSSTSQFVACDLSTVKEAWRLGENKLLSGRHFDTVIFCQGITAPKRLALNSEGIELDFCTSYLSRFTLLFNFLTTPNPTRLRRCLIFGSPGLPTDEPLVHDFNFSTNRYSQHQAHLNTIVANEALVYETNRRYPDLQVLGLNPGMLPTGIRHNVYGDNSLFLGPASEMLVKWLNPSVEEYVAKTVMPLLRNSLVQYGSSAHCFSKDGLPVPSLGWVSDPVNRYKMWEISETMMREALLKH